jgi:asparagine synthetase B (glutamine-hydrolysing)
MVGFFGSVTSTLDSARRWAESEMGDTVTLHHGGKIATVGREAPAIGIANTGSTSLVIVGAVHDPFPAPLAGSPLDDANTTAAALLQRYRELGAAFLDDVVGLYAVALFDDTTLVLARDPYGGPRIFVGEDGTFSTRLVDFAGPLGGPGKLDRSLEDFLLGHEFLPDNRTPIAGVRSLGKGEIVVWEEGEKTSHSVRPVEIDDALLERATSRRTVVAALHDAFTSSLRDLCPSSGTIGVLQGGLDSMLITSVLTAMGRDVETFTFRYREEGYTQRFSEELAAHLGIRHTWVDITPAVLRDGLDRYADWFNQPVGQPHYLLASAAAARLMERRGIRHCITGDGCDGLFLGYPTVYARASLVQRLSKARRLIGPVIRAGGASKLLEMRVGHPYRFGRNIGRVLGRPMPARGHIAACTLDSTSLRFLRRRQPTQETDPETILTRLAEGLDHVPVVRLAYMGKARVGLNAAKLEGLGRSSGIAFLSPYLHPRMVALAARIPDELNRPSTNTGSLDEGKAVFMDMVEQYQLLPRRFVRQKKMSPVTAPVDLWYWGELRDFMLSKMRQLPFETDRHYVESLVTRKATERWFRDRIGISRHVTQAAGLLASYADFARRLAHHER